MADIEITNNSGQGLIVETDTTKTEVPTDNQQGESNEVQQQSTTEETQQGTQETTDSDAQVQDEITKQVQAEQQVKQELEAKGIDFDGLSKEIDEKGGLSPESYAQLEKAGYAKPMIDAYVDNMKMRAEMFANTVISHAGGQDKFNALQGFIKQQGQESVDAFNSAVESGNIAMIKTLMNGFMAQMARTYGTANPTIMGAGQTTTTTQGFTDKYEMVKAMSDPRYGKDKQYTKEVEQRTMRSQGIF